MALVLLRKAPPTFRTCPHLQALPTFYGLTIIPRNRRKVKPFHRNTISEKKFLNLMLKTGEMAADVGSVIYGEEAVNLGLIDRIGGLSDALDCLYGQIAQGFSASGSGTFSR